LIFKGSACYTNPCPTNCCKGRFIESVDD